MQSAEARVLREHEDPSIRRSGRFARADRGLEAVPQHGGVAERRTITITGQATQPRRRRSAAQQQLEARPDRVALWAFLLGILLVLVAAATANAAPL